MTLNDILLIFTSLFFLGSMVYIALTIDKDPVEKKGKA